MEPLKFFFRYFPSSYYHLWI